jgi:hypothetical protein
MLSDASFANEFGMPTVCHGVQHDGPFGLRKFEWGFRSQWVTEVAYDNGIDVSLAA